MPNPRSTAQIAGHPIHPMLIPFPVAFFTGVLVCDVVFWSNSNPAWATASIWLLGAGIITALLAAIAGFVDFFGEPQIRNLRDAWWHMGGNLLLVVIEIINWYWRYAEGDGAILYSGLILSLIAVLILIHNGWRGWEMVYRHRVGIAD